MGEPVDWEALWGKVMKVEECGKAGANVAAYLGEDMEHPAVGSEGIATAAMTTHLKDVLGQLEHFELLCANMRQTEEAGEARKGQTERTAKVEELVDPMDKAIGELKASVETLTSRIQKIDVVAALEHLQGDVPPAAEGEGTSPTELRAALQSALDGFKQCFDRSDQKSSLGTDIVTKLSEFQTMCEQDTALLGGLLDGSEIDSAAGAARQRAKSSLAHELDASLDAATLLYERLIHAGMRFLHAERAGHHGTERPSLFESTRSMLALEGLRIVEAGDHRTIHGAQQLLELLERRLESLRSIPVLRAEADGHLKAFKKAAKSVEKLMTKQTYYEHRLEDLTRYGEISDGEDDVSDDEFSEHVKAPSMQDVQKKLAELQGRLGEQVDHAKSLREKLHALVPALPELRFERLRLRGEDGADDSAASSSMLNSSAMSMGSLALSPVPASTAALGQPPAGLGSSPARPATSMLGTPSPTKSEIVAHRLELEQRKAKLEEQLLDIQKKF